MLQSIRCMTRYTYHYQSIIRLSASVERHYFKLRCLPCENACQRLVHEELHLHPAVSLHQDKDAFGNRIQYGHTLEAHDAFVFTSYGEVELAPYRLPEEEPHPMYREESRLAYASPEMRAFADGLSLSCIASPRDRIIRLNEAIYRQMTYRPGSTDNATTAAEAFGQAAGVCQDFAHIFIALCRQQGFAARYANGFMPGIGFTHAWAEVYLDGAWIGADPTNNQLITEGYIKIAHGRDAADCPVNRGIFIGNATQSSEVRVMATKEENNQ